MPNTRVILRMDLDIPVENGQILDNARLVKSVPTIKMLLGKQCRIVIMGHRGRPEGRDGALTLKPIYLELMTMLETENEIESVFCEEVTDKEQVDLALSQNQIVFLENLRFWKGEESNDPDFLQGLTEVCQCYVDDAFAVAHRRAASIMLFKRMPGYYGLSFVEEAVKIVKIVENTEKPLLVVLGGAKEDKLTYLPSLIDKADNVLIGGKLPKIIKTDPSRYAQNDKILVAELREDGLDLSENDIVKFEEKIAGAKMVVWAGAMGMYENPECRRGTEAIALAVANNQGYKIIAGGDTGASIVNLGLNDKIDLVCSGGGVMLELLTKGTLPAWEDS